MTYSIHLRQCSGNGSSWQSARFDLLRHPMQLQPLETALRGSQVESLELDQLTSWLLPVVIQPRFLPDTERTSLN
jgi:hypothetical protein